MTEYTTQKWLELLRSGTDKFSPVLLIGLILDGIQRDNLTLADIGTSMEELKGYRAAYFRNNARKWLNRLRDGINDEFTHDVNYVYNGIERGDYTLADIGTNEEELEVLRVKSCKNAVHSWLKSLRSDSGMPDLYIRMIYEKVAKEGFSLAEFGTSEEELESYRTIGKEPPHRAEEP